MVLDGFEFPGAYVPRLLPGQSLSVLAVRLFDPEIEPTFKIYNGAIDHLFHPDSNDYIRIAGNT